MSKLIKFSLVAVLSLGLMPNTTFAQDADEDDVEEVIVTGSKIKKSVFDSSKPLEIISDAAIERTGLTTLVISYKAFHPMMVTVFDQLQLLQMVVMDLTKFLLEI